MESVMLMVNPMPGLELQDQDRELLRLWLDRQNTYLEHAPKRMENRTVGLLFERMMDTLREVAKAGETSWGFDWGYVSEKLCGSLRLWNDLYEETTGTRERPFPECD